MKISDIKREWLNKELDRLSSRGYSKADIARELAILPQSLNNILNGSRGITDSFLDSFMETFDVSQDDLYKVTADPKEDLANRLSEVVSLIGLQPASDAFRVGRLDLCNFTNNMVLPKKPFDYSHFMSIYPEIDYQWLLTGIGTMLKDPSDEAKVKCRADELTFPVAKYASPTDVKAIPLIPYDAFAGYGTPTFQDQCIEDYYIVQEFKNADFLLRIKGDSMSPKFNGGDIVACKLVDGLTFWQWHKVYAICTRSQGILIKRVEEYPSNPAFITCCSDNPAYRPFQVHEDEIVAIALVLGAIVIE